MRVVWAEQAADDLAQIVEQISKDDPSAARRVAQEIFDGVMRLGSFPSLGRKRSADASRELVFAPWPYLALYEVVKETVFIKSIRHTSRDWRDG